MLTAAEAGLSHKLHSPPERHAASMRTSHCRAHFADSRLVGSK